MQEFYQKTAWENEPSANSPINEDNLNNIEDGIGELDSRVATLSNTKSNVDWVQLQTDGKKIAEVTIDGVKKNVYVPRGTGGSGGASSWEELEEKPFETLDNNNFNVSDGILSIKDKASGVEVSAIKESLTQITEELKQSLSQLELKEINPTLSGNFGVSDLKAYKSANVVYISCTVTVSSNLTANTALMTIPYKPVSPLHFCDIRNNYSPYANVGRSGFIRGSNGVFELPNGLSAGTYYINATYICL